MVRDMRWRGVENHVHYQFATGGDDLYFHHQFAKPTMMVFKNHW
jgi:hypothetical protein